MAQSEANHGLEATVAAARATFTKPPLIGYGTFNAWRCPDTVAKCVRTAIECGVRHLDCASFYGNEKEIGRELAAVFREGVISRAELFIVGKLPQGAHQPGAVMPRLRKTLRDLQLDYIDAYLVHWPVAFTPESWAGDTDHPGTGSCTSGREDGNEFHYDLLDVPQTATWAAMEDCYREGLAAHIGVSNFGVAQLQELLAACSVRPFVNEVELHPYLVQQRLREYCSEQGIHLAAYSSLGRPAGFRDAEAPSLREDPVVIRLAQKHGRSTAQVCLRWATQQDICVIPGSLNKDHILANARLDFHLSPEDMAELNGLNRNLRFVRPTWVTFEEEDVL